MKRIPVASSNVAEIGYDEPTQTLGVMFHNGNVYQYFDVPQVVYEAFMASESKGSFLAENIKGVYRYARV